MKLSQLFHYFSKIIRTLGNLIASPQYLSRYLKNNFLMRKTAATMKIMPFLPLKCVSPMDLGLPWFSYAAIDYLEDFLKPSMKIFEWGSGGSSIFFAKKCESVYSVENNKQWYLLLQDKFSKLLLLNVKIQLVNVGLNESENDYIQAIGTSKYDVIIVDGCEFTRESRKLCFYKAESNINPGGIIILDDSWRYEEIRYHNKAKRYVTFQSVGPARLGVTSTDIYFY